MEEQLYITVDGLTYRLDKTPPEVILRELVWAAIDNNSSAHALLVNARTITAIINDVIEEFGDLPQWWKESWRRSSGFLLKGIERVVLTTDRDEMLKAWYYQLLRLDKKITGGWG